MLCCPILTKCDASGLNFGEGDFGVAITVCPSSARLARDPETGCLTKN